MMGKTLNTSENDDAKVLFIKVLLMQWTNLKLDLKFGQRYNFSFKPPNISGEIYPYAGRFRPFSYSVLIFFTGFSEAARQLWMMTVSMLMTKQTDPATANIQGLSAMR